MSATMSMASGPLACRKVIRGVCAQIAEWAGVPVWMPRVAFVILGVLHWLLALVLYFVLARVFCPRLRDAKSEQFSPRSPVFAPACGPVANQFSALDARLASLEAATLRSEADLRRAFRDLERK